MISGRTTKLSTLELMEKSEFNFHLTGSRFFGTATEKSDYDFFIEDSEAVRTQLIKWRFYIESTGITYADTQTIRIYKHPDNIHIQLVRNVPLKEKAQSILKDFYRKGNNYRMTKPQLRRIWDLVFDIIKNHIPLSTETTKDSLPF